MNDSRFTFLFQKKQRMNFFAAASSSDDEENERPLRSFIPAVTGPQQQQISPWKWGLPGDDEDDEDEKGGAKQQTTTAAAAAMTKASAPAAGTAATRMEPEKPLTSPRDASEVPRGGKGQGLTPLGRKRQLVLQPPPPPATKTTATEKDESDDRGDDDKTPSLTKRPKTTKPASSSPHSLHPNLPGELPLHITPRAVGSKEDTFLVEIAARSFTPAKRWRRK